MGGTMTHAPVLSAWNGPVTGAGQTGSGFLTNGTQGKIGIVASNDWPIIQLYTLTSSTGTYSFDVVYEQDGAD
jgi:hypothetical protein